MSKLPLVYGKIRIGKSDICFCKNWIWRPDIGNYGFILLYKGSYCGMKLAKNTSGKTIPAGSLLVRLGDGVAAAADGEITNNELKRFTGVTKAPAEG